MRLWLRAALAGLLLTTGNANQLSFSAAGMGSRNDGKNKLQLDVSGAYARATELRGRGAEKTKQRYGFFAQRIRV